MTKTTAAQRFKTDFGGKKLNVEIGKLAQQTNGSCTVQYGETVVLATAVMNKKPREGMDYFPLMVEFQDKLYATGKIKGSRFIKREGRPTDNAVLDGRMIDRGLRPLFNQEIKNDVQVVVTPLSVDGDSPTEVVGIIAASIALHISDIPWNGPLAGICVSQIDGEFISNIGDKKRNESALNLILSCVKDKIMMIDGDAKEASDDLTQKAFEFGIKECNKIIDFIESIRKEVGKEKKDEKELIDLAAPQCEIPIEEKKQAFEDAKKFFAPQLDKYLFNKPKGTKRERKGIAEELLNMLISDLEKKETHQEIVTYIKDKFEGYLEEEVTKAILEKELRIDGRKLNELRPLSIEVGTLPRTHGTGLFQRGETQVLSILTLGAPGDVQLLDEMEEDDTKKGYMHHYCSPPFSFGEAAPMRGTGRREIGHGGLAEKALMPVLPPKEDFPYTIRVVSEVMSSNGSSSMASTCGSTLALMDAGVPIKKPVAGIAMGLVSKGDKYKILTDLQDFEDGEGGMDFKITGTKDGITCIQMDTKTNGLTLEICQKTLAQSLEARIQILDAMAKVISAPRTETSKYAPKIITLHINPDKIRDLIGPGGKVINEIIDKTGVDIDIEQDGSVFVTGAEKESTDKALEMIDNITREVEAGEKFTGKVIKIMDFGAFVEILPSQEGLVHVSEFAPWRVEKVEDLVKVGDEIPVIVKGVDDQGKIKLSIKDVNPDFFPKPANTQRSFNNNHRDNNHRDRDDRGRNNRRPQRPRY
jgi:polyribonucleotide nucleotidyltransferase